jgi:hypothetical protein
MVVDNRNGNRSPVFFRLLKHGGNGALRFFQS